MESEDTKQMGKVKKLYRCPVEDCPINSTKCPHIRPHEINGGCMDVGPFTCGYDCIEVIKQTIWDK